MTIQAIREAGSRWGRRITRAITATWIRKSRSATSVEKDGWSVMRSVASAGYYFAGVLRGIAASSSPAPVPHLVMHLKTVVTGTSSGCTLALSMM